MVTRHSRHLCLVFAALCGALAIVTPAPAQQVDRLASARQAIAQMRASCGHGAQVHAAFSVLSPAQSAALATEEDRTSKLLAHWERERRVAAERLDPAGVTRFLRALETEIGRAPPAWWQDTLRTARFHPSTSATSYDVAPARRSRFTSGVAWGPRTLRGPASIPSLDGIPLPHDAALDHVDAVRTGARVMVVPFAPGRGGSPFDVYAYRAGPIELAWTATACSAGRSVLGGEGDLALELDVVANELRVWSAESHGLAIDAFELATGRVRWRFSTDFWFARHGS